MNLREALIFVRGAIGRSVLAPELEHYRVTPGRITGFNGHLALSAPIDLDLKATPKSAPFFKALEKVEGAKTVSLYLTKSGKLAVRGDQFSVYIPCLDEYPYDAEPAGEKHAVPETFVEDIARLLAFTSEDASRMWSQGILCQNETMIATNNICLAQIWNGHDLPRINIPKFMCAEIVRLKKTPQYLQTDENSLSCLFEDGSWMRSSLLTDAWPFEKLEAVMSRPASPQPVPAGLKEALDDLTPFLEEGKSSPVYFQPEKISTSPHEEDGAEVVLEGLTGGPVFNAGQLKLALSHATAVDFDQYPNPCAFIGDRLRGVIIGRSA